MEVDQNIFFDEFNNNVISLENALIDLKNGDSSDEVINEIFRDIHTIKGTSDLLGLFALVGITHKAEDLLDAIRNKKISISEEICSLFIEFKDYIALSIKNVSMGIFDDEVVESLTIYFEKEFDKYLHQDLNEAVQEIATKTLLIVEDSTIVRYMIKKIAIDNGYNVYIANNGKDGYQKILNFDIDLILCDFSTQNIGIKDMITNIKQNIRYDQIPIVMIIDHINQELVEYGKSVGANAWVSKPVKSDKLLTILNKLL